MSIEDEERIENLRGKLKEIADTPLGDSISKGSLLASNSSPGITPPPQRGVSTAEIAELVIALTKTLQENNRKLTEVTEAINAIQDSCTQAEE